MLKNQILIHFFILFCFFNCSAQSDKTTFKDVSDDHNAFESILGQIDNETYVIENYEFHSLRKFDKDMNTVFVKNIFSGKKDGKSFNYVSAQILNKKVVLFAFSVEKIGGVKKQIVYAFTYDKDGNEVGNPVKVDVRNDNGRKDGRPVVSVSADGSKLLVISYTCIKNDIVANVNINVLDSDLKLIWKSKHNISKNDKEYTFSETFYQRDAFYLQKYSVDNNGNVHILSVVRKKDVGKYAAILSYSNTKTASEDSTGVEGAISEWPVGTKGGEGYYDFALKSGPDGSTICTGLYLIKNKEAGLYYCVIDGVENKIKVSKYIPFGEDILKGVAEKNHATDGEVGVLSKGAFIPVYEIGRKSGGYYLVFEFTGPMTDFISFHNCLITAAISSKYELEWTNFIYKYSATRFVTTEVGAFETKAGALMMCYNDIKSNSNITNPAKSAVVSLNYEKCALRVLNFDETGKYTIKTPFNYEGLKTEPVPGRSYLTSDESLILAGVDYKPSFKVRYKIGMVNISE